MARKHKIIILGSTGYQRDNENIHVDCFSWEELERIKNIRDYDTLVINLLSLVGSSVVLDGDKMFNHLNLFSALEIIQNDGEIIVVGDPRFEVNVSDPEEKEKRIKRTFLYWTGIDFIWDKSPGDTILFANDYNHRKFENYISSLTRWDYSLASCVLDKSRVMKYYNVPFFEENGYNLDIDIDKFCYNRCKNAIAFSIRIEILSKYKKQEPLLLSRPIIFLPKISKSEDETMQIILRDLCGVEAELPEPKWLSEFIAPGQEEIDKKIEEITLKLENTFQDLEKAREEKESSRMCLKLLYEREYALEPATRDILRSLGAHVEDPSEKGKEDGWLVVPIGESNYEGVLEIKSTRLDQFSEDGRKQLLEWIDRGIRLREKKYKGIFIGNSAVDKPLKERPWAFSDSWQKSAKLSEICVIKTEDLYSVYLLKEEGKLDINKFWKTLFETNGIFDIKDFLVSQKR